MEKRRTLLLIPLILLIFILTSCNDSADDAALSATVDSRVATAVAQTIAAQTIAALPTDTAQPSPTSVPSPLPATPTESTVRQPEATAAATPEQSLTRRQFLAQINATHTAVSDLVFTLQLLLEDPEPASQAWQDNVGRQAALIHGQHLLFTEFEVPRQRRQVYEHVLGAIRGCDEAAIRATEATTQADATLLVAVQIEIDGCIDELLDIADTLERNGATTGSTTSPSEPLIERVGCAQTSVGFTPLTELGQNMYEGFTGGLYPGGSNERPPAHEAEGLALAEAVQPIDGQIVLLSVGMSNTRQEFNVFIDLAEADPAVNPDLVIVNGGIPGRTSQVIDSPGAGYWSLLDSKLAEAGVTPEQVQVIWLKQAHSFPRGTFPDDARQFQEELERIVSIISDRYPNTRMIYLSSRIYAGYARGVLNPEPYAYQSGFGVKWLVEEYIEGNLPGVPWLAWGPYLWADGLMSRSDGLTWECDDFTNDGTHPGSDGREKVATLLLDFFKTDNTARPWFLKPDSSESS